MSDKNKYSIWKKGEDLKLSKNFKSAEFECKCNLLSCTEQKISILLISKLQNIRDRIGPLKINSGYRCSEHNKNIGGAKSSQHILGNAVDASSPDLNKLYLEAEKEFNSIGDGKHKGFVHLDIRDAKLRWTY